MTANFKETKEGMSEYGEPRGEEDRKMGRDGIIGGQVVTEWRARIKFGPMEAQRPLVRYCFSTAEGILLKPIPFVFISALSLFPFFYYNLLM
jgi:hypothetical protein